MKGLELAEAKDSTVDRIVSACEGTSALNRAIGAIVGMIGRFGGKDVTSYLEAGGQATSRIPSGGDAGHPHRGARGAGREPDQGRV